MVPSPYDIFLIQSQNHSLALFSYYYNGSYEREDCSWKGFRVTSATLYFPETTDLRQSIWKEVIPPLHSCWLVRLSVHLGCSQFTRPDTSVETICLWYQSYCLSQWFNRRQYRFSDLSTCRFLTKRLEDRNDIVNNTPAVELALCLLDIPVSCFV